jgi:hypothetical protein
MATMSLDQIMVGLAAALALAFTAWFFLGAQWNVNRAHAGLRWLREGLPLLGPKATMRWMGTTGVTLGLNAANEPFKSAEVLFLMEPRDVIPLWLLAHFVRHRRDFMIVRGDLRRHARVEFNVLDEKSWSGKEALKNNTPREWTRTALPGGLLLAAEGPDAANAARQMLAQMGPLATRVRRVSVRRTLPHLEVHMNVPWESGVSSTDVLTIIKNSGKLLLPS